MPVSLAAVYNKLNQFHAAGLLREVAVDGTRTYFDTNTEVPHGMEIARVDMVVRLRKKRMR